MKNCKFCGAGLTKAICNYCGKESKYIFMTREEYFRVILEGLVSSDTYGAQFYQGKEIEVEK